ncbi:MAG: pyridoxal phosphate-dependent aminotransferase [Bulleidia sp.]
MSLELNQRLSTIEQSTIRSFNAMAKAAPGCISLTIGEPDFDTPSEITDELQAAAAAKETHYCPNCGSDALRTKIAEYESRNRRIPFTMKNVCVTIGASEALHVAINAIVNPGDEVIIPVPAYPAYANIVRLCGGVPVFMDLTDTDFQIRKETIEPLLSAHTKAIILNSPNNPTGTVLDQASMDVLAEAMKKHAFYAVIDAVYEQISFAGAVPSLMDHEEVQNQCILVQSFSKPYAMTGWRMGYLCASEALIDAFTKVHTYTVSCAPTILQRACIRALDYDPASMKEAYARRSGFLYDSLTEMGLPAVKPDGAFYLFPCIGEFGMDSDTFCRRMIREAGVAAVPGSAFGKDGYIRLSSCVSDADLEEAMKRMKQFAQRLRESLHA